MKLINLQINFKYFFFLFSCSVFYLFYNNQYNSIDVVKISLLFFLVLYPIFNYKIYHRENIIIIPYLHIYCLLFFIFYCLGFFLNPEFIFFDSLVNSNLIDVLLLSIIFFYLGYCLLNFFLKKKEIKINFLKLENNNQHFILYISLIYLFFFCLVKQNYFFFKYLVYFKNMFFFLLAVSLANYFAKKKNFIKKIIFLFLFLFLLFIEASNSLIFNSFIVLSCFLFCLFFLDQKKLFFIFMLFSIVIFSILQASKTLHRHIILENSNAKGNETFLFLNNIYINLNYLYNAKVSTNSNFFKDKEHRPYIHQVIRGSVLRVFHSPNVLSRVVKKTPEQVNFFNGKSYEGLIYKFIPRVLYPQKPEELYGNFWGKRYGGLSDSDANTSWNFPVLSEFYANFGYLGTIIGMFIMGCFLRIISFPIINNKRNNEANLISISIFYQFLFQESNLTLLLGNLYISLIFTLSTIYICNKISKNQ